MVQVVPLDRINCMMVNVGPAGKPLVLYDLDIIYVNNTYLILNQTHVLIIVKSLVSILSENNPHFISSFCIIELNPTLNFKIVHDREICKESHINYKWPIIKNVCEFSLFCPL
jgi:hypothetical protein